MALFSLKLLDLTLDAQSLRGLIGAGPAQCKLKASISDAIVMLVCVFAASDSLSLTHATRSDNVTSLQIMVFICERDRGRSKAPWHQRLDSNPQEELKALSAFSISNVHELVMPGKVSGLARLVCGDGVSSY